MTKEGLLAEEYICNGKCQDDITKNYIHCKTCTRLNDFLAGFKAGKEIEKEYVKNNAFTSMKEQGLLPFGKWHKVANGDLPKKDIEVLNEEGDKVIYTDSCRGWIAYSEYYEDYVGVEEPIAWCEVPKFEEADR